MTCAFTLRPGAKSFARNFPNTPRWSRRAETSLSDPAVLKHYDLEPGRAVPDFTNVCVALDNIINNDTLGVPYKAMVKTN